MNKISGSFSVLLFIIAIIFTSPNLYAQGPDPNIPPPPGAPPPFGQQQAVTPVERISPGVFKIGDILLNKKERSIRFPAQVNMDKGLLEYLIVSSGGKTHESLFRTKANPYDLQIAFLLLGFEGTDNPLSFQGAPDKPGGEPLEITVEYSGNKGKQTSIKPEEWIILIISNKKEKIKELGWVFTGSIIVNGQFIAQTEGSIASIFHDPTAMIDNTSKGGESDEVWFVNEETVPSIGTPVTITIKAKE